MTQEQRDTIKDLLNKEANTGAYGNQAVNVQSYAPIMERRDFTPNENVDLEKAKSKIIPQIFTNWSTPIHAKMSSPGWAAAGGAALGGVGGSMLGNAIGKILGAKSTQLGNTPLKANMGAAYGGGAGALLAGILAYHMKKNKNQDLEESIRRLPEGATLRDLDADPAHQARMNRQAYTNASRGHGGGIGAGLAASMLLRRG